MKGKVLNISLTFSKCTWLYFNKSYTFKIVDYHNDPLILLELRVNPIRQGLSSKALSQKQFDYWTNKCIHYFYNNLERDPSTTS